LDRPGGVRRRAGRPMRLLHQRHDHVGDRALEEEAASDGNGGPRSARRKPLPLRQPRPSPARRHARVQRLRRAKMNISLDRRQLLFTGGALVVSFAVAPTIPASAQQAAGKSLAADAVDSYLVIAPDGAVKLYTGKVDLGTGSRAAYRSIVA